MATSVKEVDLIKQMNIYEKIMHISEEIGNVQRDLTVEQSNGKVYTAFSESAVLNAIKPLESKYRVYSFPAQRTRTSKTLQREYVGNDGCTRAATLLVDKIDVIYRFVNVDNPDEFIEITSFGTGIDTNDKGAGKGMTYADKYALMKAYKLTSCDDPDTESSPQEGFVDDGHEKHEAAPEEKPNSEPVPQNGSMPVWMPPGAVVQPAAAPKRESTQRREQAAQPQAPNDVQALPAEENQAMSLEEARSIIVPIGTGKGKTLGELFALDKGLVQFYASERFRNQRHEKLKEAAKCLLQVED